MIHSTLRERLGKSIGGAKMKQDKTKNKYGVSTFWILSDWLRFWRPIKGLVTNEVLLWRRCTWKLSCHARKKKRYKDRVERYDEEFFEHQGTFRKWLFHRKRGRYTDTHQSKGFYDSEVSDYWCYTSIKIKREGLWCEFVLS